MRKGRTIIFMVRIFNHIFSINITRPVTLRNKNSLCWTKMVVTTQQGTSNKRTSDMDTITSTTFPRRTLPWKMLANRVKLDVTFIVENVESYYQKINFRVHNFLPSWNKGGLLITSPAELKDCDNISRKI